MTLFREREWEGGVERERVREREGERIERGEKRERMGERVGWVGGGRE